MNDAGMRMNDAAMFWPPWEGNMEFCAERKGHGSERKDVGIKTHQNQFL